MREIVVDPFLIADQQVEGSGVARLLAPVGADPADVETGGIDEAPIGCIWRIVAMAFRERYVVDLPTAGDHVLEGHRPVSLEAETAMGAVVFSSRAIRA